MSSPWLHCSPDSATRAVSSAELAAVIAAADFTGCVATVVGYGNMGRQYVKALRALGVKRIHVCSRSKEPMGELEGIEGISTKAGGFQNLDSPRVADETAIIATPIEDLVEACLHLARLGYKKVLVEKPVCLWSARLLELAEVLENEKIESACAYNRVAYPSYQEAKARAVQEGGVTSCTYTFTEFVAKIGPGRGSKDELARWGIANSLHVMSMAHGLIGLPTVWKAHRSGRLSWHPSGTVFVGSGISDRGIPFSYHADWGSTGRWSVEVHSAKASYRLCPLEKLMRKTDPAGDWEEIPVVAFDSSVKAGFVEQVASLLRHEIRELVPLVSLRQAAALAKFGEAVFGYSDG